MLLPPLLLLLLIPSSPRSHGCLFIYLVVVVSLIEKYITFFAFEAWTSQQFNDIHCLFFQHTHVMWTKCVVRTHVFALRLRARYERFELFRILHIFWIVWIYGIIICHSFSTLTLLNTKPAKLEEEEEMCALLRRKIGRNFYDENEPKNRGHSNSFATRFSRDPIVIAIPQWQWVKFFIKVAQIIADYLSSQHLNKRFSVKSYPSD